MAIDPTTGQETTQSQYNFDQEVIKALQSSQQQNLSAVGALSSVLKDARTRFNQGSGAVDWNKLNTELRENWRSDSFSKDLGNGFKVQTTVKPGSGGTSWKWYQVVDAQGNVLGETTDRNAFTNQVARGALAKASGFGDFLGTSGTNTAINEMFRKYAGQAGISDFSDLKAYESFLTQQRKASEGNYGTFINAAGKQVVATTPEQLKGMTALGFRKVAEGTSQLTAEQQQMVASGRQQVEQQIQQALASGQIDTATAQKLMAGQQEGDVGAGIKPYSPPTTVQAATAGRVDEGVQAATAPTSGVQINSSTGVITLENGRQISPQDPSYQQYLQLLPSGAGLPSGTQLATGQVQAQPADAQLAQQVQRAMQTNGGAKANADYINAVFKAYHNRDATAQELQRYQNMTVAQAGQEIIGGAPQPFTQQEYDLLQQGMQRIENPQQLSQLAGLNPDQIVRVGNKMFAPAQFLVDKETYGTPDEFFGGSSGVIGTQDLGVGKGTTGMINDVVNDYFSQYIAQVDPAFAETRKAYWSRLLSETDFRETKLRGLFDEFEIEALSDQLTDLDKKIAAKQQAWDTAGEDILNSPMSLARITGLAAHTKRMASIEMQGLLAQREALVGDYDRAVDRINGIYDAAVKDYEENITNLKDWYNENLDWFTTQEKRQYEEKIKAEERAYDLWKDDLDRVKDLMMEYPTAGISMNDSLSSAVTRLADSGVLAQSAELKLQFNPVTGEAYMFNPATGQINVVGSDIFGQTNPRNAENTYFTVEQGSGYTYECGYWARTKGDYAGGVGMGDLYAEKTAWVNKYGTVGLQGVQIGDLVISDGSDVSASGQPTTYGHAYIVGAIDANGNIYAYESNARGDKAVTFGRIIDPSAAYGYVRGNMTPQEFSKMQSYAMQYGAVRSGADTPETQLRPKYTPEFYLTKIGQEIAAQEDSYRKEFNALPIVKDYDETNNRVELMNTAWNTAQTSGNLAAVDQALITAFNKILDPTSVVRESEYARTPQDLSFINNIKGRWEKISTGGAGLTNEDRAALVRLANDYQSVLDSKYEATVKDYIDTANRRGLDPINIVTESRREGGSTQTTLDGGAITRERVDQVNKVGLNVDQALLAGWSLEKIYQAIIQLSQ